MISDWTLCRLVDFVLSRDLPTTGLMQRFCNVYDLWAVLLHLIMITPVHSTILPVHLARGQPLISVHSTIPSCVVYCTLLCLEWWPKYRSWHFLLHLAVISSPKFGHLRSLHWHPCWLSCINEYLAIDSGGHVSDLVVARNCCMTRMLPGEAELVSEWTGLPGRAKSVKRFERSNGLDTALYKNYLYLFKFTDHFFIRLWFCPQYFP